MWSAKELFALTLKLKCHFKPIYLVTIKYVSTFIPQICDNQIVKSKILI